jgi:hypothetical protein
MFEVIISHIKTGRVQRKVFDSRDEAERHIARKEELLLYGKRPRSLRDFRMEIHFRDAPRIQAIQPRRSPAAAA